MYLLKRFFILIFLSGLFSNLGAQSNLSYGIKAGLGLSNILGDKEANTQGTELETNGFLTGFHIGASFNIDIIEDKFGVAPELLFMQKGMRYQYEGEGRFRLKNSTGNWITFQGIRDDAMSVFNSYMSIPVMLYYKPVDRVKLSLGIEANFLVNSVATGEYKFTDSNQGEEIIMALDFNFYRDDVGEAKSEEMNSVSLAGIPFEYPSTVGAYYFNDTDEGNYFNVFDFGLNADVTFFITKGMTLGLRTCYNILDTTNDKLDFSKQNLTELRADSDNNLSFLLSLGFSF